MRNLILLFLLMSVVGRVTAQSYHLTSPDKNFKIAINTKDSLVYSVVYKNTTVIAPSAISLDLDKGILGRSAKVIKTATSTVQDVLQPLYGKSAVLLDITTS